VARAIAAAGVVVTLRAERADLRARFAASSLRDAPGLARAIEAVCFRLRDQPAAHDRLRQLFQTNEPAAAAQARALLAADPKDGFAAHVAGLLAYRQGAWAEADRLLRVTRAQTPDDPEANANHAAILRKLGRLAEAEQAARAALRLAPERTETHNNLGNILRDAGQFEAAITSFETAVRARPDFADAWANLAWVRVLCGQAEEAERAARHAIAADPTNPNGHNNLGLALMRQSRLREAEDALRQALTLKPDFALAHSNILFCLNYREDLSAEAIFAEYQDWDRRHARPLAPAAPGWNVDTAADRRLRVGYVSPDFRHHAVAMFAEPLLAAHDRSRIELFCYAELALGDATTERFKAMADHWRPTIGMDDDAVAAMIRADGIDVLVDLAGHTAGNRLLVFARRPAPVQVAFMLGHGYTSGLSAIDAFLADEHLVPLGSETLFSETVVRLPRIPLAYLPPAAMPDVTPPPCLRNGFITFGYFGRTVRLNDRVLGVWAALLRAIPTARLMLNNGPFAEPAGRDRMLARFAALGITADRLILTCTAPQPVTWAAYGAIDIALDPFPHNAGTTTIEALWMGVPVLTLADRPSVGRFGASILATLGLEDWVAADPAAYIARAVRAASDPAALAALRADLRPRFQASPLHDARGLAAAIEDAYRALSHPRRTEESPRALFLRGDIEAALAAAARLPNDADSLHIQALVAFQRGDPTAGAALLARAPARADLLTDRGVMLRAARRPADAEAAYRAAIALDPDFAPALGNLGNLLLDAGQTDAAEALFTRALAQTPDQPWLLRGKALALIAREAAWEAETLLRRALAVAPNDAEAHETLGALLCQTGRPIEAEQHHRAGLRGLRDRPRSLGNLAIALQTQGRHQEADACYHEALRLRPTYASMHGNALFGLNYRDDLSAEAIFAEYRAWDTAHAAHAPPIVRRPRRDKLRVGYISPDFRQHAVAHFALPWIAAHDRSSLDVILYAEVARPDAMTARFRDAATLWRDTAGLTDEAVAAMIRDDGVDVIVDLAGHTGGNRLLALARRPAAVQIEALLGLGTTTGMRAMDAFLADDRLAPPGTEAVFSEQIIRLPRIPLVYAPQEGMPAPSPSPCHADGTITFGYFGRVQRLTPRTIATWSRILRAVEGSRLLLNSHPFTEPAFRALIAGRFAEHGVGAERLEMRFTAPQSATWETYAQVDIALDPFPHNAGTTTIEALWMGVPVITRADRPTVGRLGAAILGALGLDDWVAADDDTYVARAVALAADPRALTDARATLRERFEASPLRDAPGLTAVTENAYRALLDAASSQARAA
jgi:predicted O-linked N-acetylglucosamine transferase (SPINDLY family)